MKGLLDFEVGIQVHKRHNRVIKLAMRMQEVVGGTLKAMKRRKDSAEGIRGISTSFLNSNCLDQRIRQRDQRKFRRWSQCAKGVKGLLNFEWKDPMKSNGRDSTEKDQSGQCKCLNSGYLN